jgi:hypothetical protein
VVQQRFELLQFKLDFDLTHEKFRLSEIEAVPDRKIAYLIECPCTTYENKLPTSVSLTAKPCDNAENNLKIINIQPVDGKMKKFGVCTKQVTYKTPDFTIRFVEVNL